jgi:hypothetical protein
MICRENGLLSLQRYEKKLKNVWNVIKYIVNLHRDTFTRHLAKEKRIKEL